MSLVQDIATYIEANSSLVMDTDLFVGAETVNTPSGAVVVRESPGSVRNESGLEERAIQLLAIDRGYINAETLLNGVFNLFVNMPGFGVEELQSIFFVNALSMPGFVDRDASGKFVFSSGLLFRMKSVLDAFVDGASGGVPTGYLVLDDLITDVGEIKSDYMKKAIYDIDIDGIVDEAEKIDGGSF